ARVIFIISCRCRSKPALLPFTGEAGAGSRVIRRCARLPWLLVLRHVTTRTVHALHELGQPRPPPSLHTVTSLAFWHSIPLVIMSNGRTPTKSRLSSSSSRTNQGEGTEGKHQEADK
ncbi:hypothetical protein BaRGS_00013962, partial [Batillaria attramentaria]